MAETDYLLDTNATAKMLGCSARKVRDLPIPFVRVDSKTVRYDRTDVERWLEGKRNEVYFILSDCSGYVKIGFASNVHSRLAELQMANPDPLELLCTIPGDKRLERKLHKRWKRFHHRGEWFRFTAELEAEIYEHVDEVTT